MSVKKRKNILDRFSDRYRKVAVVFEVPDDVLFDRLVKRSKDTGKMIPLGIVKNMKTNFQEPTHEEGFDEITTIGEEGYV